LQDTSLFETQLAALANVGSNCLVAGVDAPPRRADSAHPSIVPYQVGLIMFVLIFCVLKRAFVILLLRFCLW
jgi:hypothetical protein